MSRDKRSEQKLRVYAYRKILMTIPFLSSF